MYIYALVDPRDKRIKYVGKTNNPDRRYDEHVETEETTQKAIWIQELRSAGVKPTMILLNECNEPQSDYQENWWITVGQTGMAIRE